VIGDERAPTAPSASSVILPPRPGGIHTSGAEEARPLPLLDRHARARPTAVRPEYPGRPLRRLPRTLGSVAKGDEPSRWDWGAVDCKRCLNPTASTTTVHGAACARRPGICMDCRVKPGKDSWSDERRAASARRFIRPPACAKQGLRRTRRSMRETRYGQ
jgi:hypothetical protein